MNFDEIPTKAQRVFKEISECFDEEAIFITCIGLNQVWSGQFQKIHQPRHHLNYGGAAYCQKRSSKSADMLLDSYPGKEGAYCLEF